MKKRHEPSDGFLFPGLDGGGSGRQSSTGGVEKGRPASARGGGQKETILVGTSGYSFADWVGNFYPEGIRKGDMLSYYVEHFPVVEMNSSYYRIPRIIGLIYI